MTGLPPPALVQSLADLNEYSVEDGSPVNADPNSASSPYNEEYFHQSILKRYPEIESVVHSHSLSVLPFADGEVTLMPVFEFDGFLGAAVPVFNITNYYEPNDMANFLIVNTRLGAAIANDMSTPQNNLTKANWLPNHSVILQPHHGFTAAGRSIQESVFRAYYTQDCANVQSTTMQLWAANAAAKLNEGRGAVESIECLNERQIQDTNSLASGVAASGAKAWPLWEAEVRASPSYHNDLAGY